MRYLPPSHWKLLLTLFEILPDFPGLAHTTEAILSAHKSQVPRTKKRGRRAVCIVALGMVAVGTCAAHLPEISVFRDT